MLGSSTDYVNYADIKVHTKKSAPAADKKAESGDKSNLRQNRQKSIASNDSIENFTLRICALSSGETQPNTCWESLGKLFDSYAVLSFIDDMPHFLIV
ncbi:MAG: hypothetical protein GX946_01170 [Oligosphaeraceae bacterium]|nr:hypothetical protein [Oligosphaeraceae bacterium]